MGSKPFDYGTREFFEWRAYLREVRRELMDNDPHCWFCGRALAGPDHEAEHWWAQPTIDHLVAMILGGDPFDRENLKLCCKGCNMNKAGFPVEFLCCTLRRGSGLWRPTFYQPLQAAAKTWLAAFRQQRTAAEI